jgi:hypothetical protein
MSTGLLFVTAPEADYKLINLVLLQLRDWDYGSGDRFKLVTTKNAYDLEAPPHAAGQDTRHTGETSPPLSSDLDNAWAGAALEDVEAFCVDLARDEEASNINCNAYLYVVVDSTSLQAESCILGHRAHGPEAEDFVWLDRFDKVRVPWGKLYSPWCNLEIGNMGFEEWTQEFDNGGEGVDGWYTFKDIEGDGLSDEDENNPGLDREIQRFRDAGHI